MLDRTPMDLSHKSTEELESVLGSRLLGDLFLASLIEELCFRQIDKEHERNETAKGDQVVESQGIIRGTRYFLEIRRREKQRRDTLDEI